MTARANELHATADRQIGELIGLVSTMDEATRRRPCPGREKLGDGTVGASARHAADNYGRIAAFVQTRDLTSRAHVPAQQGEHQDQYTADALDVDVVVRQLSAARGTLRRIAELTDRQLDTIPPKDSFRFCDGQRTLEQILAGLLKHQRHQIDALTLTAPTRSAQD
jgi:hypothetical protein